MVPSTEKEKLRIALSTAFDKFIAAFSAFADDEVNTVFPTSSWTPAQVASHIMLATDGVPDGKTNKSDRGYADMLAQIRPSWEDLNQKFESPVQLRPDDKPREKSEVLSALNRIREKDLAVVNHKDLTEICADFELPGMGYLTRYEWLWFIEMHLKRHEFQLNKMR